MIFKIHWIANFLVNPIYYKTAKLSIDNKKINFVKGIFKKEILIIDLDKIVSIELDQTLIGRLFKYGTVKINVGYKAEEIKCIKDPKKFVENLT